MTGVFSSARLNHYNNTEPKADLRAYFSGPIKAWGLIQNWRGHVITRFDVEMFGTWEGDTGTLQEAFRYYDDTLQKRTWTIKLISKNRYQGTADDIVGVASGASQGSAINWRYQMDVPVGRTHYRLTFDDWMWQMNEGVMINRSYLKKFGFTVAELTLFMQKQSDSQ